MTSPILFDHDPLTGTETWWHFDPTTEVATLETRRDVGDITEFNKGSFNQYDERAPWESEVHNKVASIPDFLFYQLSATLGLPKENPKAWKKWLNDKDNLAFRTRPGRV